VVVPVGIVVFAEVEIAVVVAAAVASDSGGVDDPNRSAMTRDTSAEGFGLW
jgi:hypothetical protein